MNIKTYLSMARPAHWLKNIFILPGIVVALFLVHPQICKIIISVFIGLASACFIAASNYIINEWVDASFDRFHPIKKYRTAVVNDLNRTAVYFLYTVFVIIGLALASAISTEFLVVSVSFLIMGILYNVKPFRTKDRVYLDVISESVNNPIRLMLGWFIVTNKIIPPSSLLLGYWAGGAFLMTIKRYAELRAIGNTKTAGLYRNSFRVYTEEKLLIMAFFYAMFSAFFLGVFLIKYRIELLFSLPLFAILFTWYFYIGSKPDSNVQYPERLYREKAFMAYVVFLIVAVGIMLFIDLPGIKWFLNNAFISISQG